MVERGTGSFAERVAQLDRQRLELLAIQLDARLRSLEGTAAEPVAIVGIGCRFPGGANHPEDYWRLLQGGVDAVTTVPADRWEEGTPDGRPDRPPRAARRAAFLQGVDLRAFDAEFFGISATEAASVSPQQRLLLEVAWEALEQGGIVPTELVGTKTGVFVGIMADEYQQIIQRNAHRPEVVPYLISSSALNAAAGRMSFVLGLRGPSLSVDAACASSLVAVHLACQSLRSGECDLAIAGGVSLILLPSGMTYFDELGLAAPDGRCKAFDASADGSVRGEGCGVIVLKRLADARRAGDRVLALVRGSAVNHGGGGNQLQSPSGLAQQEVMRDALARAGVSPLEIGYVEAHGTSSPLGDAVELTALGEVYGRGRPAEDPLYVGSAKPNIGHLEAATGMASLLKVILAMQNQQIPPHPHFRRVNPDLGIPDFPYVIPTSLTPWAAVKKPRLAGVSAFGWNGTNSHVVIEEAPSEVDREHGRGPDGQSEQVYLLPISARSSAALAALARDLSAFLTENRSRSEPWLADVCYSASVRRAHHRCRFAVLGHDADELIDRLGAASRSIELAAEQVPPLPLGEGWGEGVPVSVADTLSLTTRDGEDALTLTLSQGERGLDVPQLNAPPHPSSLDKWRRLAARYGGGAVVDWREAYPSPGRVVALPSYPWQRRRRWIDDAPRAAPTGDRDEGWSAPVVAPEAPEADDLASIETQLRELLTGLLGGDVAGVDRRVPLIQLGLTSLQALELRQTVAARYGVSLPLAWLASYPLADLAREIQTRRAHPRSSDPLPESWSSLVALRPWKPGESREPFYCVTPIVGAAFAYLDLARSLAPDQAFYALQPRGVDGATTPCATVEELAALHVQSIEGAQPRGPYRVGGWSFGAIVAYEVARQLMEKGHEVALLAAIDTPAPVGPKSVAAMLRYFLANGGPGIGLFILDYLALRRAGSVRLSATGTLPLAKVLIASLRAGLAYVPRPYVGSLALFRTDRQPGARQASPDEATWAWENLVAKGVSVHRIPGRHIDLVRPPHVSELGRQLQAALDQVGSG